MPVEHTFEIAGKMYTEVLSRGKAIKRHCKGCCAGSWDEVKECHLTTCPLYPFRLGKDPGAKKRIMTDEQKSAAAERFKKRRESKAQQSEQ